MQIPIMSGAYTDSSPGVRESYPINLTPIIVESGVSSGFLKPADGIVNFGIGAGRDRAGINWNGECYRVMGNNLIKISSSGIVTVIGDVGSNDKFATMDYSFDRLAICSNGNLFYYDGATLTQVTDIDLGVSLDIVWVDGYFMSTDGEYLVVTELADPTLVDPIKYGSSEASPDPIVALKKIRNEIYAVNRYTCELFDNVGSSGFPFRRVESAQIQKGSVGTHACCVYQDMLAFVGGARNEEISIYLGNNGEAIKIGTRETDEIINTFSEPELSEIKIEARNDKTSYLLYVHLPDRTLVYDHNASLAAKKQVWSILISGVNDLGRYRAVNMVYAYDRWIVGDPIGRNIGFFDSSTGSHWGEVTRWEFGTMIVYNESNGAIFNELELVTLTGSIALGDNPKISTSFSTTGQDWSKDQTILVGGSGDRGKRLVWHRQGLMRNYRVQRFRGDSSAHLSFLRLEAKLEALNR